MSLSTSTMNSDFNHLFHLLIDSCFIARRTITFLPLLFDSSFLLVNYFTNIAENFARFKMKPSPSCRIGNCVGGFPGRHFSCCNHMPILLIWDCSMFFIHVNSNIYIGTFGVVIPTFTLVSWVLNAIDIKVIPTLPSRIARTPKEVILREINMLFYFFRSVQQPELLNTPLSLCEEAHGAEQS